MKSTLKNNLLPKDGEVFLFKNVYSVSESDRLLGSLYKSVEWKQEKIKLFGKWHRQPRLSAWYGERGKQYTYSGITLKAKPWNTTLLNIKSKIQTKTDAEFNSGLLNYYRNGQDSMGWHRDNEKELGPKPVIGSISLGATRTFCMQHIKDKQLKINVELSTGSYLIMQGDTQHFWRHCVPKQHKCSKPRLNITFRNVI